MRGYSPLRHRLSPSPSLRSTSLRRGEVNLRHAGPGQRRHPHPGPPHKGEGNLRSSLNAIPDRLAPSGMTLMNVTEPAPSGPQRVGCEPSGEIEGGVQGSPARWVMVDSVRAKLLVTGGSCQADLLRQRPRVGLPRPQVCEACGGTAPRPASATPRERAPHRTRMPVAIAELAAEVKNKVRTLLTASPHHGTARLENNVYATAQNGPVLKSGICTYCRSSLIRQVTLTEAVNSRVAGGTIWTV